MPKRIFCFDSGTKNLGIALLEVTDWKNKIAEIRRRLCIETLSSSIEQLEELVDNIVKIIWAGTVNILPNEALGAGSLVLRAGRLKGLLSVLDAKYGPPDVVLLEDQMHKNFCTNSVNDQVIYHYAQSRHDYTGCDLEIGPPGSGGPKIVTVSGRLKNSIVLDKENVKRPLAARAKGNPVKGSAQLKYRLNKANSRFNYIEFCRMHPDSAAVASANPKADEADAFMMGYAYVTLLFNY